MVHLDDQYDILKVAPFKKRVSLWENLGMNWKGIRRNQFGGSERSSYIRTRE
jgi:hypothetical protein